MASKKQPKSKGYRDAAKGLGASVKNLERVVAASEALAGEADVELVIRSRRFGTISVPVSPPHAKQLLDAELAKREQHVDDAADTLESEG